MITNKKALVSEFPSSANLLEIAQGGLWAINIEKLIENKINSKNGRLTIKAGRKVVFDLRKVRKILIVGFGKGSFLAINSLLKKIPQGKGISLDVLKSKTRNSNKKLTCFWGTHPHPSSVNIQATNFIKKSVSRLTKDDLVIYFIGGGGSALLCSSKEEMDCCLDLFKKLTKKGATIQEINTVRKHLSDIKGGGLAKMTKPAKFISLIASDVCGNDLSFIASGPTVMDKTRISDAIRVIEKYKINFNSDKFRETPKDDKIFKGSKNILFACNQDAALAMLQRAKQIGYTAKIISLGITGDARKVFIPFVRKIKKGEALILAGETTVTIKGRGIGGRNQEAVLSVLNQAAQGGADISNVGFISLASDGYDNTPFAGAIATREVLNKMKKKKINPASYIKKNNSYLFFKKLGSYILTDKKSFNVSDLAVILRDKK